MLHNLLCSSVLCFSYCSSNLVFSSFFLFFDWIKLYGKVVIDIWEEAVVTREEDQNAEVVSQVQLSLSTSSHVFPYFQGDSTILRFLKLTPDSKNLLNLREL